MSELQLTQHGIDRLNRMRKEVLSGNFTAEVTCRREDGSPLYFFVRMPSGSHCAFVSDEKDVPNYIANSVSATLNSKIRMRLFEPLELGRWALAEKDDVTTVYLGREDYSTPAQRALESLGKRLGAIQCTH